MFKLNQTESVCNVHVILLWLMLPRDHFVSRYLYFTTTGAKCCVAAVKCSPLLHFSVVIFFWSFGITFKCWELSTAQVGPRGREGCCTYSLSLKYRLNQTESAIVMLFCCDKCFRGITLRKFRRFNALYTPFLTKTKNALIMCIAYVIV
jgi:hypothetical protein